ncbi:hypothetical protein [Streptomyces sp. STCH 565 A]|uniref:hypothetical protein n=1 Tax=Streptomyces sp. STCH 565 A TaxID=2950532 RepID=UPI002075544E|nr:hypothetical protein [Streptomyces sp. STCH 565 A]MCM8552284.1 hypothetical protein [Streptomyces sp. STCH 565 A]
MSKTWTPAQSKKFARELKLGKPYYFVYDISRRAAPYEDAHLYSEVVFTGRLGLTGTPCTDGGQSAATLCLNHGPMFDAPPRGLRNIADPSPQVAAPLGSNDYEGDLLEVELRGLEKQAAQTSNPKTRRRLGGWRV